jgi:NADPH:quinone reductase-like Zn-dependent oxidoreductase
MVLASTRNLLNQWFPPKPTFTEAEVPSQQGKVFIVTGGNGAVGYALIKILYRTGATIYMASRSKARLFLSFTPSLANLISGESRKSHPNPNH